jgi:hypothetical protein
VHKNLIAIEHDGVRQVHAIDVIGSHATACGLDGGIDGYNDIDGSASIMASAIPFCFCMTPKHLNIKRVVISRI